MPEIYVDGKVYRPTAGDGGVVGAAPLPKAQSSIVSDGGVACHTGAARAAGVVKIRREIQFSARVNSNLRLIGSRGVVEEDRSTIVRGDRCGSCIALIVKFNVRTEVRVDRSLISSTVAEELYETACVTIGTADNAGGNCRGSCLRD